MTDSIPALRVTPLNVGSISRRGHYVLYWMIAARRTTWSFALDHAIASSRSLGRPLVVFEALRAGYPWASDRFHAFVLQGMADNALAFAAAAVTYVPYVEPEPGRGAGLVEALAKRACVVVTDEQPGFFLPRMIAAAAARIDVRVEQVDGNGIVPLRATDRAFVTAASFRRQLQKVIVPHLVARPAAEPLSDLPLVALGGEVPGRILGRWRSASLATDRDTLARLPIDHLVAPVPYRGGATTGAAVVDDFITRKLARYADDRNDPDVDASSGLSPYLHFGHVSAHDVAARVWSAARWDVARVVGARVTGSRAGWWGLPAGSEAFLDQLVTWRELGYGFCFHRRDYGRWSALPAWARATLDAHASDHRPVLYSRSALEEARTADPIWNAAQRQLVADGRIQNYLRMLWGKKILEWSRTPRAALATMIELNNKYAVDGRDPNSYTGILWTLGLFDRAWGPVRPIFGTVRYMSSASTARKLQLRNYLRRWS